MKGPFVQLAPEQASTMAGEVDTLFYFLVVFSLLVAVSISGFILYFVLRYRRRTLDTGPYRMTRMAPKAMQRMELLWIAAPLLVFMAIFYWGAKLYAGIATPPADAMPVYVVGKQWMWKVQHVGGHREINELHIPVGRPVRLTMTSEDVIHSFYVPAFRVKTDVVPGRYTSLWFEATKVGEYHLFCAEYCGTKHAEMIGKIVVMRPKDFETWLSGGNRGSLAEAGAKLFKQTGCNTCHNAQSGARGPRLDGVFGSQVQLANGETVLADQDYLRDSILNPRKHIVAGYQPIMPTYVTQLSEEQVIELVEYIISLSADGAAAVGSSTPASGAPDSGAGGAGGGGGAGGQGGAVAVGQGGAGDSGQGGAAVAGQGGSAPSGQGGAAAAAGQGGAAAAGKGGSSGEETKP